MDGGKTPRCGARLGFGAVALLAACSLQWEHPSSPVAANDRPNVVVIVTDDQDYASLPAMRKLMAHPGGSWVNFANAHTNQALCCVARSTLLTGEYAHHHGVLNNQMGEHLDDTNTIATWLNDAGYRTGLFGKYLNAFPFGIRGKRVPGWDVFKVMDGLAPSITGKALAFLDSTPDGDPFFLYVAYKEPHKPALPKVLPQYVDTPVPTEPLHPNYNEADLSDKPTMLQDEKRFGAARAAKLATDRANTNRALLGVDDGIAQIVDNLAAAGELNNTIVVVVADNGFSWGSHRIFAKNCAYDECTHIPLMIRYPGAENRIEERLVSNVDIVPTIAEFTGVTPRLAFDGRSLVRLLDGTPVAWQESVLIEKRAAENPDANFWGVRVPDWLYVEYANGERELYDMGADPYQLDSLDGRPEVAEIEAWLAAELARLRSAQ